MDGRVHLAQPQRRLGVDPFHVTGIVAELEDVLAVVLQGEDLGGHLVQQVAVVRDQHHRAAELVERRFQRLAGGDVQVVGRLIEQQQFRLGPDPLGEQQSAALAAGQARDRLEDVLAAEAERREVIADLALAGHAACAPTSPG